MKYSALKKMLEEKEGAIKETAEFIGVTEKQLYSKLEGESPLFSHEIFKIVSLHNIESLEDRLKFFYPKRPENGTKRG